MSQKNYNILVVEDEWMTANFITQILQTLQHKVLKTVSNAEQALAFLNENNVDFIFMDINIDGPCDGITLAQKINLQKNIPIIYITAFDDSSTIEEATQTNIYGFIVKPFVHKDIETVLNVAIAQRKKEQKHSSVPKKDSTSIVKLGKSYTFDLVKCTLYHHGNNVLLSKNESKLLQFLCLNQGNAVSTEEIQKAVWKEKDVSKSNIRDTILRIRKKIFPLNIKNITSVGYMLVKDFT